MMTVQSTLSRGLLLLWALLLTFPPLDAQQLPQEHTWNPGPYAGPILGVGLLPGSFHGGCESYSYPTDDLSEYVLGGFVLGLPIGRVSVEARTLIRRKGRGDDCPTLRVLFDSGTYTVHKSLADIGTQTTTDLRVGFRIPGPLPLAPSMGVGWVWGNDIPYWTGALGYRATGRVEVSFGLAWESYRMPYRLTPEEWQAFKIVRTLPSEDAHHWESGWSLQVGIGWPFRLPS